MTTDSRPKAILISSFASDPTHTGESAIGWLFCKAAALSVTDRDIHLVAIMNTQSQAEFDRAVKREGLEGRVSAVTVRTPRFLERVPRGEFSRVAYLWWAWASRKVARKLGDSHDVIYAHHVTYASEILPSPISAMRKSVYKVWGPVGAGGNLEVYRVGPDAPGRKKAMWMQAVREATSRTIGRVLARRMDLVVCTNLGTSSNLNLTNDRQVRFPNTILEDAQYEIARKFGSRGARSSGDPIQIICVGRFIPLKRFELAVTALASPALASARLTLVGAPPSGEVNSLEELAQRLGVHDRVNFAGRVSRERAIELIGESDVLFHPAAREGSSGVVGEASAVGTPVVCFASTGAASVLSLSGSSGIIVEPRREMGMDEIASVLAQAADLPRVQFFGWTEARFSAFAAELLERARPGTDRA